MSRLRLETPSLARIDSYRGLVAEFRARNEELIPFVLEFPAEDAAALLRRFEACAREMGLDEVLVTCAKGNEGSVRTIQANGGELVSEEFIEGRGTIVQRYRIPLA